MQKLLQARAEFGLGQVVRHRIYPFRGVVFDVDPEFNNTEEWYQQIPEDLRPRKDQPLLPPVRGERGRSLHRLCKPAELASGHKQPTVPASADSQTL